MKEDIKLANGLVIKKAEFDSMSSGDKFDLINIYKYKNGDIDGLSYIYNKYQNYIKKKLKFKGIGEADSEDIMMNIMEKMIFALTEFTYEDIRFINYLNKVITNAIIDYYRNTNANKRKAIIVEIDKVFHSDYENSEGVIEEFYTVSTDLNVEEKLIEKESVNRINKALEKLCETDKEIVKLMFFEEMTYKEISNKLNISENSIRIRLHRIRQQLEKIFEV